MQQLREFQGNLENIREEIAQEGLASTCRYACRTSVTGGTQAHYAWRGLVVASLVSIIEVNLRWARLVLGWVTVSGFDSRRRHFISVWNQPPRSTQPSTLRGTVKLVPAKGRWCSASGELRQAWWNLQVKLCDSCLSAFEALCVKMRYTNRRILYVYFQLITAKVFQISG